MTSSSKAILAGLDEAMRHYSAFLADSNREAEAINATTAALRAENMRRAASGVRVTTEAAGFEARDLALKTRALRHFEARAKAAHTTIGGLQAALRAAASLAENAEAVSAQQVKAIALLQAERTETAAAMAAAQAQVAELQTKLTEAEAHLSRYTGSGPRYGGR
ncbi:MAG: hypothetical protein KF863_10405 [Rubrivivax sp.]|nr:hypothetical protein [Rubrivivax sp.]